MNEYTTNTPFPTDSIYDSTSTEGAHNFKEFRKEVEKQEKKITKALDNVNVDKKKKHANDIKEQIKTKGLGSTIKVLSRKAGQATVVGALASTVILLPLAVIAAKKFLNDNDNARKEAIEQLDKELLIAETKMEQYKTEGKAGLYAKWTITRKKLIQAKGQLRK